MDTNEETRADEVDGTQDSQLQPTEDSQLQTPQADQPIPSEEERQRQGEEQPGDPEPAEGALAEPGPSGQRADRRAPAFPTNDEQQADHERRQNEVDAQRYEHNERIAPGGGQL